MRQEARAQRQATLLIVFAVLATLALLRVQALHGDASSFFAREEPAEWILYPSARAMLRPRGELEAIFVRRFELAEVPREARLALRIHREGELRLNGEPVPFARSEGRAWKRARRGEVAALLRPGENVIEVRVSTRTGFPALWLSLEGEGLALASDASWTASLMGAEEAPARLATVPLEGWPRTPLDVSRLDEQNPRPADALASEARALAAIFAVAGAAAGALAFALRRRRLAELPASWAFGAWLVSGAAWIALFAHNAGLSGEFGFDSGGHRHYVKVVLQGWHLPLADEGWQMYQPPLYYLLAASWLKLGGFTSIGQPAIDWLRWLGCFAGILQSGFLLLALRELLPGRPGLVLCAFVFGASLPVNLYLFQQLTNEPWLAMLSSASLWWAIRMLRRPELRWRDHAILGLGLGLAMLAKFSALIPLLLCTGVVFAQRWLAAPRRPGPPLAGVALTLGVVLLVCGWHYARVALHFGGNPFVGNWDEISGQSWWQDPGYHTLADYTRFGRSLERPLMSAEAGVPDALYSTLWGDGMLSGVGRIQAPPPWNIRWMAAGYAIALGPCLALLLGGVLGLADFARRPRAERFLVVAVLGATVYALLNMTLRLPYYAQAKAFYGLSALVPLAFAFALGFDALALRRRWLAPLGVAWLAGWALLAHATFFGPSELVRLDPSRIDVVADAGGWLARAEAARGRGAREEAIASLARALAIDPDQGPVAEQLAKLLREAGRGGEALAAARAALRVSPAGQTLHLLVAELWLEQGSPERAAYHYAAAERFLPESARGYRERAQRGRALALRAAGRFDEAIAALASQGEREALPGSSERLLAELLLEAPPPLRDPARALVHAEAALGSTREEDPAALETLAAALAANARPLEAAAARSRALELRRARGEPQALRAGQRESSSAASP